MKKERIMNIQHKNKKALVLGAGGFIGNHLVNRLKMEGYWVRGVDLKYPEYQDNSNADDFIIGDLRDIKLISKVFFAPEQSTLDNAGFDEVYQLAADMGGAGYIFSGENDANVMHNSAIINLNVAEAAVRYKVRKLFYSSSACMYPAHNQVDPKKPNCSEESAYPANPDSEYGWEKLFSERLFLAYKRNYNLNVRIARFHNIFGPLGTWDGGKEKAPAAICRKVIEATSEIEIWGDGRQTRSFLYIDECIEGIRKLMESDFTGPVNIGSEEMITIYDLVEIACSFENKALVKIYNLDAPTGVRGRNSCNKLIKEKLNWEPSKPLVEGLKQTYFWIKDQIKS
jgi:nucleoside-diphosphate-sugar epimerase